MNKKVGLWSLISVIFMILLIGSIHNLIIDSGNWCVYFVMAVLELLMVVLTAWQALLAMEKTRLYFYGAAGYSRITGSKELLNSIGGIGGHIVIGSRFEIKSGLFFSGHNSVTNHSINGFDLGQMTLAPIDETDSKELDLS